MRTALKYSLFISALLLAQPAYAFFSWQSDDSSFELRGLIRGSAITLQNPDNPVFYDSRHVSGAAVSGRLMLDLSAASLFSFEAHAVQNYIPLRLQSGGSRLVSLQGVERSDLLDFSYTGRRSHALLDRLNVQFGSGGVNVKAGRQPVNLAATWFFTPNDFFSPFAAQTFFRAYKAGVDAIRADIQLAELSQLSLISVLGYRTDTGGDNGWSNRPDAARTSYLGRASAVFGDFEFALLAGVVRKDGVIGGDFQGELFEWLGVRGEGHLLLPDAAGRSNQVEIALGLEHRWENSFTIRIEQFYHGGGATHVAAYAISGGSQVFYQARHYTAAAVSYEFTPLLTGDGLVIYNWIDQSSLVALYALYSLSDESELALSANLSTGKKPVAATIRSEFGMLPDSLSLEIRAYF